MPATPDAAQIRKLVAAAVGLAAVLLVVNIALTMQLARRSGRIRDALEGLRGTTADLRLVPRMNRSLEQMTRGLQAMRRGEAWPD